MFLSLTFNRPGHEPWDLLTLLFLHLFALSLEEGGGG